MRRFVFFLTCTLLLSALSLSSTGRAAAEPGVAVRLTSDGCCVQPFWSPDGKQVRYIDRPPGGKLGIYGVAVAEASKGPSLVSERVEDSRITGDYRVETNKTVTTVFRLSDGKQWRVPAQGRTVAFSPDYKRIAWRIADENLPPERQVGAIWVAATDGTGAKRVASLPRGSLVGWISNETLLVSGYDPKSPKEQVLWSLALGNGQLKELVRSERLRGALLSPLGRWIVYYIAFNPGGGNGLYLVSAQGGEPKPLPREAFGAYQWRPGSEQDRLLIVPFRPEAKYHELWQLDPESLKMMPLISASQTPFKIANNDWRVSPDGRYITYVESADRNIWVLELP